jgi:hypothetical protein
MRSFASYTTKKLEVGENWLGLALTSKAELRALYHTYNSESSLLKALAAERNTPTEDRILMEKAKRTGFHVLYDLSLEYPQSFNL